MSIKRARHNASKSQSKHRIRCLLPVRVFGIEDLLADCLKLAGLEIVAAEIARLVSGVAGCDLLLNLDDQRITLAIQEDFAYELYMLARFAFHHKTSLRTAENVDLAGLKGESQRVGIHVAKSERLPVGGVNNDCGDESILIEFDQIEDSHGCFRQRRLNVSQRGI